MEKVQRQSNRSQHSIIYVNGVMVLQVTVKLLDNWKWVVDQSIYSEAIFGFRRIFFAKMRKIGFCVMGDYAFNIAGDCAELDIKSFFQTCKLLYVTMCRKGTSINRSRSETWLIYVFSTSVTKEILYWGIKDMEDLLLLVQ